MGVALVSVVLALAPSPLVLAARPVAPRLPRRAPTLVSTAAEADKFCAGSPVQSVASGTYSGLVAFLDAAAFSSIVFAPAGLPLDIGILHALVGFVLMQTVTTRMTGASSILAPPSYEVMPFLAKFAMIAKAALPDASMAVLLATVLAGSLLINVAAAVILGLLSRLPIGEGAVEKALPPPMQAGLFAAIGWLVYTLAFDTLSITPLSAGFWTFDQTRLWVPAHVLVRS